MVNLKRLILLGVTIGLLFLTTTAGFAEETLKKARIIDMEGQVMVKKSGGEKNFPVFKGMELEQGDSVITFQDSRVKLEVDKEIIVKGSEKTQINIRRLALDTQEKSVSLNLWRGKAWVEIDKNLINNGSLQINTPNGIIEARGTQFYVGVETNGLTELAVLEGLVSVSPYSQIVGKEFILKELEGIFLGKDFNWQEEKVKKIATHSLDLFALENILKSQKDISGLELTNIENIIKQKYQEKIIAEEKITLLKPRQIYDKQVSLERNTGSPGTSRQNDDGAKDDGTEDDGTEDDGTEDDGTEDDGTKDDGTKDEDNSIIDPEVSFITTKVYIDDIPKERDFVISNGLKHTKIEVKNIKGNSLADKLVEIKSGANTVSQLTSSLGIAEFTIDYEEGVYEIDIDGKTFGKIYCVQPDYGVVQIISAEQTLKQLEIENFSTGQLFSITYINIAPQTQSIALPANSDYRITKVYVFGQEDTNLADNQIFSLKPYELYQKNINQ